MDSKESFSIYHSFGNFIDNFVGVFSPNAEVERKLARNALAMISERGYDATKPNRFNKGKVVTDGNINSELLSTLANEKLRKHTRDLTKNSAIGRSLKRALVAHIVARGVTLQARIADKNGNQNQELNRSVEKYWKIFEKNCDLRGKKSFTGFLRQAVEQLCETGEYIIHKVERSNSYLIPLKLESVDSDVLASSYNSDGVIGGIKVDSDLKPVEYYFYPANSDVYGFYKSSDYSKILAKDIIHAFIEDRPGQVRGEPWFAPCLNLIWSAHRAIEAELYTLEVQACLSVVYKSSSGGIGKKWAGSQSSTKDDLGNVISRLSPASIVGLTNAEDIKVVDPARPGNSFTPFIDKIVEYVSASLGISYAKATKDYSKGNFSSQRMADSDDRRHLRPIQQFIIDSIIQPIYAEFIDNLVMSGLIKIPDYTSDKARYQSAEWTFEPYDYIQPVDDAKAEEIELNSKVKTYQDSCSEKGRDWQDHFNQLAQEKQLANKLGIEIYGETKNDTSNNGVDNATK